MPHVRSDVWLRRLFPFVAYHHVCMMLLFMSVVLQTILLTGSCKDAGGLRNVYILSVSPPDRGDTVEQANNASYERNPTFEARIGYFGICAHQAGRNGYVCSSKHSSFLDMPAASDTNTMDILAIAEHFRADVIFPGLIIASIALSALCFFGLSTFPGWHEEQDARTGSDVDIKPFPSRPILRLSIATSSLSSIFALTAALWQHVASAATSSVVDAVSHGQVVGHVGAAATALVWLGFGLTALVAVAVSILMLSISVLDRLIND